MRILKVKNYEKYQRHEQKNPTWIRLYRSLLTDRDFLKLSVTCRYIYVCLLILASETSNCVVNDVSYLSHRCAITVSQSDLNALFRSGLLIASRSTIARIKKLSETETETETEGEREGETETPRLAVALVDEGFEKFYSSFPRHIGKEAAQRAWRKLSPTPEQQHVILEAIERQKKSPQWQKDNGQFIPYPSTWLNGKRWNDELPAALKPVPKSMVELL